MFGLLVCVCADDGVIGATAVPHLGREAPVWPARDRKRTGSFRTELEPGAVRSEPLRSALCVCVRARDSDSKSIAKNATHQIMLPASYYSCDLRLFSCP